MKLRIIKKNEGYTLVEMLFYISLFAVLSLVIINSLITMTRSFRETSVYADLVQSSEIMERISREIKQAQSINAISSNSLRLNTRSEAGTDKIIQFSLNGSNVEFLDNDVLIGNLNTQNIVVTDLSFTQITTTRGTAVKVTLSTRSTRDNNARIENFYDTVVLRGDYGL